MSSTPTKVTLSSDRFNEEGYERFDDACAEHMDAHKALQGPQICIASKKKRRSLIRVSPWKIREEISAASAELQMRLQLPPTPVTSVGFLQHTSFINGEFEDSSPN